MVTPFSTDWFGLAQSLTVLGGIANFSGGVLFFANMLLVIHRHSPTLFSKFSFHLSPESQRPAPGVNTQPMANENVNPPLSISGVSDDAESLALIMDDPDAVKPAGKVWDHWVV